MKIDSLLKNNLRFINDKINSDDVATLDLTIGNSSGALIFAKDIVDQTAIGELVLRPLQNFSGSPTIENLSNIFLSPEKRMIDNLEEALDSVVNGEAVVLVDGLEKVFSFGLRKFEKRAIVEPPTFTVIKGPREGFNESLPVNISLMRRKLKTTDLTFENLKVGKYSKTPVALVYVKGIVDPKLVEKLKKRIQEIEVDAVLDSSYVTKSLGEHKKSLFKQIGNTEKPDILASKILEGRVGILVDGSPIALSVPYLLIEDFQSPSDYYSSSYSATVSRTLRIISVIISLLLPSFFVSAELFHLQLIPLSFLLTIVNSIKGIPLSPSYEMFFTLLIFEILNEASVRMPRYVGMVVSIVGGLVLGETAVTAGIISAPTLMIVAFSGICLYTVPELEQTFSVLRLVYLIVAGALGAYGLLVFSALLLVYLVTFENYSTPLCAPFSPLIKQDLNDSFYKGFFAEQSTTPKSIQPNDIKTGEEK